MASLLTRWCGARGGNWEAWEARKTSFSVRMKPGLEGIWSSQGSTAEQEQGWNRSNITASWLLLFKTVLRTAVTTKNDVCTPALQRTLAIAFNGSGMFKQHLKRGEKNQRWLCKWVGIFVGASISKTLPRNPVLNVNTWTELWASWVKMKATCAIPLSLYNQRKHRGCFLSWFVLAKLYSNAKLCSEVLNKWNHQLCCSRKHL